MCSKSGGQIQQIPAREAGLAAIKSSLLGVLCSILRVSFFGESGVQSGQAWSPVKTRCALVHQRYVF